MTLERVGYSMCVVSKIVRLICLRDILNREVDELSCFLNGQKTYRRRLDNLKKIYSWKFSSFLINISPAINLTLHLEK